MDFFRNENSNLFVFAFLIIIIFTMILAVSAFLLNRIILRAISGLAAVTTDLPDKLRLNQKILWPANNILEIEVLIRNFRSMSSSLAEIIQEYRTVNQKLADSENQLKRLAYDDQLTGLPNRRYFMDHLQATIERKSSLENQGTSVTTVMLIDLDRFKQVNDTLGHDAGDALLKQVSDRLRNILAEQCASGFVSRLGGDEFVLVLESVDRSEVERISQGIINILRFPVKLKGQKVVIGSSIGISLYPIDGTSINEILKKADISIYAAKDAGGDTFVWYSLLNQTTKTS